MFTWIGEVSNGSGSARKTGEQKLESMVMGQGYDAWKFRSLPPSLIS
jgi:hypothetical protein